MENTNIDTLINMVNSYDKNSENKIREAYKYAEYLHEGQKRQSGEPYIIHPLNVAYILSEMHADKDTICAALLHDTLEDTNTTYEEIREKFGNEVAKLVNGVTKISKMNYNTKKEQNLANTRKIITSITQDVRIIIIKLADRLHNMRTIQYKTIEKQLENANETLQVFVPLANLIGVRRIKDELEDISLKCIDLSSYQRISSSVQKINEESNNEIQEMLYKINEILAAENIPTEIKIRTKNIYGIYKKMKLGYKLNNIHDLISFKILVEEINQCYLAIFPIHQAYKPVNELFKDYIARPKPNYYQSLHTTVFAKDGRLIQMQLRTKEMEKIGSFGLAMYWQIKGENARITMQETLKRKYQFYSSLEELDKSCITNEEFVNQVTKELLCEKVYVFTASGRVMELPEGATIIDFAYYVKQELGDTMVGATVNNEIVPLNYKLKTGDRIKIQTDYSSYGPRPAEWEQIAFTKHAKEKIKEWYAK